MKCAGHFRTHDGSDVRELIEWTTQRRVRLCRGCRLVAVQMGFDLR